MLPISGNHISSIWLACNHPSLPSASFMPRHSFMLLSVMSTRVPSCITKTSVPVAEGVFFTFTVVAITIAPFLFSSSAFCCHANRFESMKRTRNAAEP